MEMFGAKKTGPVTEDAVLAALRAVQDPDLRKDIVSLGLVKGLAIQGGQVSFTLEFTTQPAVAKVEIHSQARKVVGQLPGVSGVKVAMGSSKAQAVPGRPGPPRTLSSQR